MALPVKNLDETIHKAEEYVNTHKSSYYTIEILVIGGLFLLFISGAITLLALFVIAANHVPQATELIYRIPVELRYLSYAVTGLAGGASAYHWRKSLIDYFTRDEKEWH